MSLFASFVCSTKPDQVIEEQQNLLKEKQEFFTSLIMTKKDIWRAMSTTGIDLACHPPTFLF
jgi:hypothetical protein